MNPLFIINFKAYSEAVGRNALRLAQLCERHARSTQSQVIITPASPDLALIASRTNIQVFSQHMDIEENGAHTGAITAAHLHAIGVKGTLINHSEHPVSLEHIRNVVMLCKKYRLTSVVCAKGLQEISHIVQECTPDFIAYEHPELIGKTAITSIHPSIIKDAAEFLKNKNPQIRLLCGAGIKDAQDAAAALKLGAVGVLASSAIAATQTPEQALAKLITKQIL